MSTREYGPRRARTGEVGLGDVSVDHALEVIDGQVRVKALRECKDVGQRLTEVVDLWCMRVSAPAL